MKVRAMMASAALVALAGGAAIAGQAVEQSAAPSVAAAPAPPAAAKSAILPATQALFDGYVADRKLPGIVAAFGAGPLPTEFVAAGRIADESNAAAAGPDSLWRVYSMTKPITAMAAMILVEEGKLKLDQPIADFFPGFAKMRVLTSPDTSLASVAAKNPITVRNLLTHTAGLGYGIITKGPLLAEYNRLGITPAASDAASEAKARPLRPTSLAAFAERVATLPLIAEPGTKWSYSIALDVTAAVVEKAAGMPFETFVQTRLFDPLGMNSTYWTVPASEAGRLATNYAFIADSMKMLGDDAPNPLLAAADFDPKARFALDPGATSIYLKPPSFPYGGAGLVSSARDYDRFLHMLQNGGQLDGKRVMKPETVALATSNLLPAGVYFTGFGTGAKLGFGAGGSVYLEDKPGGPSKGTYGWGGAAGTIAYIDPVKRVRGTIMVNYFPDSKWPIRDEIPRALAQGFRAVPVSRPGFTGGTLDRADRLRRDHDGLASAIGDWRARLLRLDGLTPEITAEGMLGWTNLAEAPDDAFLILLGLDAGRPRFAALPPAAAEATAPAMRNPALMAALAGLAPGEAAIYAAARSLIDWHGRHGFCARCGAATAPFRAGWGRSCPGCRAEHFPRVDPVVIMIAEHDGRALLGRGRGWPEGRYSALAGFVEPAESIEEAVAREISEEAGVLIGSIRYVASQPWPFPSQLMIACIGEAVDDALLVDKSELEDARWFTRDQVRAALAGEAGAAFIAPPHYAIAHTLLEEWAG